MQKSWLVLSNATINSVNIALEVSSEEEPPALQSPRPFLPMEDQPIMGYLPDKQECQNDMHEPLDKWSQSRISLRRELE